MKVTLSASVVDSKRQRERAEARARQYAGDLETLANLITPDPPEWLPEHFERWATTIFMAGVVEKRQPTRSEMKRILDKITESTAFLRSALGEASVREFLDAGGNGPMDSFIKFQLVIGELQQRSIGAAKLPALVNASGKAKSGRTRALPDGAISAQTYCALLIAETWKWFRGEYPSPRNQEAAAAIDLYWKLAGGAKQSWGNNKLASWRHHLIKASKIPAEKDRAEYRRHLRETEYQTALLRSPP